MTPEEASGVATACVAAAQQAVSTKSPKCASICLYSAKGGNIFSPRHDKWPRYSPGTTTYLLGSSRNSGESIHQNHKDTSREGGASSATFNGGAVSLDSTCGAFRPMYPSYPDCSGSSTYGKMVPTMVLLSTKTCRFVLLPVGWDIFSQIADTDFLNIYQNGERC